MSAEKRQLTQQEIVSTLLDTGAINFEAIGSALATHGPDLALYGVDGWDGGDGFCGTMRYFVHVLRWPVPRPWEPPDDRLGAVAEELRD